MQLNLLLLSLLIDYLVTRFHYDHPLEYSPAVLTDLRSAMVNNETFAVTAVRNNFHLYLKHQSLSLSLMIDGFVRAQEDNGHLLMHDVIITLHLSYLFFEN